MMHFKIWYAMPIDDEIIFCFQGLNKNYPSVLAYNIINYRRNYLAMCNSYFNIWK